MSGAERFDMMVSKYLFKCSKRPNSDVLFESIQKLWKKTRREKSIYQQDNTPIHKSTETQIFFQNFEWYIPNWPPYKLNCNSVWTTVEICGQLWRKKYIPNYFLLISGGKIHGSLETYRACSHPKFIHINVQSVLRKLFGAIES